MRRLGSLYILLAAFAVVSLGVLALELSGRRIAAHPMPAAAFPHSPAEFPEMFDLDPLEGLEDAVGEYPVPRPPLDRDFWPCRDCHEPDWDDPERRVLVEEHEEIELRHDEENRWCLDCHDFENRNRLRLASGERVRFTESYRLCGQCHGTIYRDWRLGIHGRRTGYWDGPKRYMLCVHCHYPHAPKFEQMAPLPPPVRPDFLGLGVLRDGVADDPEPSEVGGG